MADISVTGEKIYIISSPDQPCPGSSIEQACVTLQEFAKNSSTTAPTPSELTLELLPGIHSLQSHISITGVYTNTFIMKGSDATIQCIDGLSSMEFPNVQFVKLLQSISLIVEMLIFTM